MGSPADAGGGPVHRRRARNDGTIAGTTVIAGYPWFSDWARDTMISLPGLTLATGRTVEAASILRTFAAHVSQGMLPNRFPEGGEVPEYNTVDANLWYFHAMNAYLQATGDHQLLRELYPTLREMVEWHRRGTRYSIHVDPARRLAVRGRAGAAAHVDGRKDRRLGSDAADWQARRDQRFVALRARLHGELGAHAKRCARLC